MIETEFTSIEICAGAGGQAVGLRRAGFHHLALVEIDEHAVETLRLNVQKHELWGSRGKRCAILDTDVNHFDPFRDLPESQELLRRNGLDLLAGGVPCPPFSHAGKQLGKNDERDLFPRMLELVASLRPRAVMIENVRGIMDPKFEPYRDWIAAKLQGGIYFDEDRWVEEAGIGYTVSRWDILEASDFGVPQLRPRAVLVAFRDDVLTDIDYRWPVRTRTAPVTLAEVLEPSMRERFRPYFDGVDGERAHAAFERWREKARRGTCIAPTLVGGSKKHGGADLGPSRAKRAWRQLGVDPMGIANDDDTCARQQTQERDLFRSDGPMLTVRQAALLQGFPPDWEFAGGKTAQYRQVGNAFPPPVAEAVGESIINVLNAARSHDSRGALRQSEQLSLDLQSR
ncbi:DNA cytosine methyltransferase [Nocardia huaxiensis]|uniref:DNA cytosine methyltransferase n=1 Tax=Nocardia huaxiensis TaxID=2755382 RepID=UPI001E486E44|nr:DNA (cytosine-5-)-methyltransferase [Nocardia huaxiensis]UFS96408.1 DNA cytosine methyltransferase [Nocardia huaxiensis]